MEQRNDDDHPPIVEAVAVRGADARGVRRPAAAAQRGAHCGGAEGGTSGRASGDSAAAAPRAPQEVRQPRESGGQGRLVDAVGGPRGGAAGEERHHRLSDGAAAGHVQHPVAGALVCVVQQRAHVGAVEQREALVPRTTSRVGVLVASSGCARRAGSP